MREPLAVSAAAPHPALLIRSFRPADQTAARRLILSGLVEHFGFLDVRANPDLDDIAAAYLAQGHVFLVAESGGEVVGTAGLLIEDPEPGRIVRVSVARERRRQGIARALMAQLWEDARRLGLRRLWVETNDDWTDAISLYTTFGFVETARHDGSIYLTLHLSLRNPFRATA